MTVLKHMFDAAQLEAVARRAQVERLLSQLNPVFAARQQTKCSASFVFRREKQMSMWNLFFHRCGALVR